MARAFSIGGRIHMDKREQLSMMEENKMYICLNEIDSDMLELWAITRTLPNGEPVPGLFGVFHSDFLPKIRSDDGINDDLVNDELWLDLKRGRVIELTLNWQPYIEHDPELEAG
jgi:hypothetical protein